jgi:Fe-S-cluster containining protein
MKRTKRPSVPEAYPGFSYARCATCCREPIVPVTHYDVIRLARGMGLKTERFLEFFTPRDIDRGRRHMAWLRVDGAWRLMGLKLRRLASGSACVFWHREACRAYGFRPVTFRLYPFELIARHSRILGSRFNDVVDCRHGEAGRISFTEIKRLDDWEDVQDDLYAENVKTWNRQTRGRTGAEFIRFALDTGSVDLDSSTGK